MHAEGARASLGAHTSGRTRSSMRKRARAPRVVRATLGARAALAHAHGHASTPGAHNARQACP